MSLESIRERNKNGKLDKLLKAAGRTSMGKKTTNNEQEATYYPERDKSGNGSCIIRFLPGLMSEDEPYYVERFQHGFEENGKWFIEFCPKTIGKECPVCDYNQEVKFEYGSWDDCPDDVQKSISKRGYNAGFGAGNYCNVLVIKDPVNPENEGKVHLFSFKKAIMNLIMEKANPKGDGLGAVPEPVDVFDLVDGADFKFIIRKKDGRADYSKSSFEASTPCPEFDHDTQHELFPITDEKLFKTYEELSERFDKLLNKKSVTKSASEMADTPKETPKQETKTPDEMATPEKEQAEASGDGDDDNMAYFQGIADEANI